uniref:PWWP domain-containing protein n=1 Tax=Timema shepardi TaxID=629360 RepID=A0A7R9FWN9_TIMSH|nr:unnamed protein product [Timema shepardi]
MAFRRSNRNIKKPTTQNNLSSMKVVSWTEGDLVWARVSGYPYWPGIVVAEPNRRRFIKDVLLKVGICGLQNPVPNYHKPGQIHSTIQTARQALKKKFGRLGGSSGRHDLDQLLDKLKLEVIKLETVDYQTQKEETCPHKVAISKLVTKASHVWQAEIHKWNNNH